MFILPCMECYNPWMMRLHLPSCAVKAMGLTVQPSMAMSTSLTAVKLFS